MSKKTGKAWGAMVKACGAHEGVADKLLADSRLGNATALKPKARKHLAKLQADVASKTDTQAE
jgi:hypothetical protein